MRCRMSVSRIIRQTMLVAAVVGGISAACTSTRVPPQAQIVLSSTTVRVGDSISGYVVIDNPNVSGTRVAGCGSPFAVAVGNDQIKPDVVWPTCLQYITIPFGRSKWPITVDTLLPTCPFDSGSCPLPPGEYRATLLQGQHVVQTPPSVAVRVTG